MKKTLMIEYLKGISKMSSKNKEESIFVVDRLIRFLIYVMAKVSHL
jgi:hypothetical protein